MRPQGVEQDYLTGVLADMYAEWDRARRPVLPTCVGISVPPRTSEPVSSLRWGCVARRPAGGGGGPSWWHAGSSSFRLIETPASLCSASPTLRERLQARDRLRIRAAHGVPQVPILLEAQPELR